MKTHTTLLCAIISFGVGIRAAPALEARAGEYLGGIDMERACHDQYYYFYYALSYGDTCDAWSCLESTGNAPRRPIDTPAACVSQYGKGVYAACNGGRYGWGCFRA
jgi:hypothetical protein